MFDPSTTPRVMALPIGCDFSTEFVAGLRQRLQAKTPDAWARVTIFVNTRRSARRIEELLSNGPAAILPNIRVIGDLASDLSVTLPQPPSDLDRHLLLADLVGAFLQNQSDLMPKSAMFDLAKSLITLLDELDGEGSSIAALETINVENLSGHWQRSLAFLNILKDYIANLNGKMSGAEARQRAVIAALAENWRCAPPTDPIIVAGSTGSRGATAMFIKAVADLPQGAVVLPGFDFDMPDDVWPELSQEHPQFGFAKLAETLEVSPTDIPLWHAATPASNARNALISLSLRPAPVTAQWRIEGPHLLPTLPDACKNLTLLEAQSPRLEATAIAIRLRQALSEGLKSALITPDRLLARRVSATLQRWDIEPDDSAGHPAQLTPPGIFMRMVSGLFNADLTPLKLLELLKHPLFASDDRGPHLRLTRRLEVDHLRGGPAFVTLDDFDDWAAKHDATDWLGKLKSALVPSANLPDQTTRQWAETHRQIAETLSGSALWDKEAGKSVLKTLETLSDTHHSTTYSAVEYRNLFGATLAGEVRSDPVRAHPDIAIWGTLEARVQSADLVILAGLNDGIWPQISRHDTWLNRDMRRQIGLQLPERRIGLSAHDYQQSLGAAQVILSRSIRDGEAPTVPSRWLMRLQNLLAGLGETGETALEDMRARGQQLLTWAAQLDAPQHPVAPAKRPAPAPPLKARPQRLSVTRIEALIRDPYAIYAQYVLKLRPLDPLTRTPDHMAKGNVLHEILERFVDQTRTGIPDNAAELYEQIMLEVLNETTPWPATRRLWRAQFLKTRDWFILSEAERRDIGHPAKQETKGHRALPSGFELTAKADRIDITPSGAVSIYDYKSGSKPSEKQIRQFSIQLPLEGVIAESGGFENLHPAKIQQLQLIYLGGNGDTITFGEGDPAMDNAWENLCGLIARYQVVSTGYPSRLRPELTRFDGDYDHLARRGEWADDDPFTVEEIT
ncbi:MAG: double-strand break repair protein AddB [Rhodobacteraceae bacterium]|nr:double-strand break repair protein AddB [Paracoccaceae bacterium]